jgi:hypothetical protein
MRGETKKAKSGGGWLGWLYDTYTIMPDPRKGEDEDEADIR